MRCVVTGQVGGKAVIVSDGDVEPKTSPLMPGTAFHQVWGTDEVVSLPSDGVMPAWSSYFPPATGFRFGFFTLGPDSAAMSADLDIGAAVAEFQAKLPGLTDAMDPDGPPGMHTTDTVDYGIVVSGDVWLELDDGAEVELHVGDCYVQNGTRHAWHNRTDRPVTMAIALVGARRA
ncbi:MAG: Cupin 2, conserved barrel domain protein [Acidimicrobiales bacterium]|jgi:quercetin dioxygenase-like cupin family protein|nr:Cupin 2, conserved barrel domain protein [Acidimicrobiales bacterium]